MLSENKYLNNAGSVLAVLALSGAIVSAQYVGNTLAWAGIIYYLVCIAAIVFKHPWAKRITWGAVGFHVVLISYSLWNWFTQEIPPCPYCFIAAGLVLFAATALQRVPMAVLPVLLITTVWFSWPYAFAGDQYVTNPIEQTTITTDIPADGTVQTGSSEPADGNAGTSTSAGSLAGSSGSDPGKQTVTTPPRKTSQQTQNPAVQPGDTPSKTSTEPGASQPGNEQPQTEPPAGTDPDPGSGDKPDPGLVNPNPGSGDKPAKPESP
ncbi:MAG: hypothetical protein A4E53_03196 [Pelotomaculum sp. PtaB.Bin104]|nr:MAG: hypothetical protein A4E53_03196 [Pelotomaculum sp. PtaB.Bin104]